MGEEKTVYEIFFFNLQKIPLLQIETNGNLYIFAIQL